MKVFTKESLVAELKEISQRGWIPSCRRPGNDGAVGNTLEGLLGITENNLALPNAAEWEIKGQRRQTSSLLTLFHMDPSPRALKLITKLLLPKYGWPLDSHPDEWSFRQTISVLAYSDRGFRVVIDDIERKVVISFNASAVGNKQVDWLRSVEDRVGLGELNPQPYWGFDDLEHKAGSKLTNTFCVLADAKTQNGVEYFQYNGVMMLQTFGFEKFLGLLRNGSMKIDFDARSGHGRGGHNHGTKFRIQASMFPTLYEIVTPLFNVPLTSKELLERIDTSSFQQANKSPKKTIREETSDYQISLFEQEDQFEI
jgi:hypothetical protein